MLEGLLKWHNFLKSVINDMHWSFSKSPTCSRKIQTWLAQFSSLRKKQISIRKSESFICWISLQNYGPELKLPKIRSLIGCSILQWKYVSFHDEIRWECWVFYYNQSDLFFFNLSILMKQDLYIQRLIYTFRYIFWVIYQNIGTKFNLLQCIISETFVGC